MELATRNRGSFRDPAGFVFEHENEIFRAIMARALEDFRFFFDSERFQHMRREDVIVDTTLVTDAELSMMVPSARQIVRHERVPFISYPFEWPFELLKCAALLHLKIQIDALEDGISLSDASAYNIQFRGPHPVFIDLLSFRKYREGEIWAGQRQFFQQFLNPLLLQSLVGVPYHDWYRGSPEGISSTYLAPMIPWRRKMSFSVLAHVIAHARMEHKVTADTGSATKRAAKVTLSKAHYRGLLRQLHQWVGGLQPLRSSKTTWQDYDVTNTYDDAERVAKRKFIQEFCQRSRPSLLLDIGCNTGEYSQAALEAGAAAAVGLDFDHGALGNAYRRATERNLNFLPLYQDAANPTPALGWRSVERASISERGKIDAVLGLAVEHHLAIARNIPLDDAVDWLVGWAPQGVLEFVPKTDPTIRTMLALREDSFDDYSQQTFEAALLKRARIVKQEMVSSSQRVLYAFDRS
jgi:ribosomal protein L11 methylase PrmA